MGAELEIAGRFFSLEIPEGWTFVEESSHCELRGSDPRDLVTITAGARDVPEGSPEELAEGARQLAASYGDRIVETGRARIGGREHCTLKVMVDSPSGWSLRRQFHLSFPGRGNYFIITGTLARDDEADPHVIERREAIFRSIATSFALRDPATAREERESRRREQLDRKYDLFVSYKRDNAEKARFIAEQLTTCGLRVWLDDYELALSPVDDLRSALERGVRRSTGAVLLTNDLYLHSPFCRAEAEALIDHCGAERVLHLRLKDGITSRIDAVRGLANCRSLAYGPTDTGALRAIAGHFGWKTDFSDAVHPAPDLLVADVFGHPFSIDVAGWQVLPPPDDPEAPRFVRSIPGGKLEVAMSHALGATDLFGPPSVQSDLDDKQLFEALKREAAANPRASRVRGVHVLNHKAVRTMALTVQVGFELWQREAHVFLQHPRGKTVVDFCLAGTFPGPFSELCRHAHLFDRLVRSLRWPAKRFLAGDLMLDDVVDDIDVDDYSQVEKRLRAALAQDPRNPELWNELGISCFHLRRILEAQTCFERALALNPTNPKFVNSLLGVAIARGRAAGSRSVLRIEMARTESLLRRSRQLDPDYQSAFISEAQMRAMCGSPATVWRACLDRALGLLLSSRTLQTGRPISRPKAEAMIRAATVDCQGLAERWATLPD